MSRAMKLSRLQTRKSWNWWKISRRLVLYPSIAGLGILYWDYQSGPQRATRNLRALWTSVRIIYEYKRRWNPTDLNSDLHRRVAEMILETCQSNGGLYIKFGQGIASMNHILPKEYNEVFQVLHDKAPSVPYYEIQKIILEDLQVDPNLIFAEFDEYPIASASIAQVHKARLHDGREVAIKIQKPYIAGQVPWDLACYKILLHAFEYFFDLPLVWSAEYTDRQMRKETDFVIEAMNGQKTLQFINNDAHIFNFHHDYIYYTKQKYLQKLQRLFQLQQFKLHQLQQGEEDTRSPDWVSSLMEDGNSGQTLEEIVHDLSEATDAFGKVVGTDASDIVDDKLRYHVHIPELYPQYCTKRILTAEWCEGVKVTNLKEISRMGLSFRDIMDTVVSIFGWQIFVTGFVHCDPHPGNLLVRKHPDGSGNHQVIFLDHGLYIEEPDRFRKQYCAFWTAMFLNDLSTMEEICHEWGVGDMEFFASVQLIKPFLTQKGGVRKLKFTAAEIAKMQMEAKDRIRTILLHTRTIPRQLVFVGRNMNLVRANNKDLGSPVNRINILANYAARGTERMRQSQRYYWTFKFRVWVMGMWYTYQQLWKSFNEMVLGRTNIKSFEEEIEEQMENIAQDMGMTFDTKMFDA